MVIFSLVSLSRHPTSAERSTQVSGWASGDPAGHRRRVPGHLPAPSRDRAQLQPGAGKAGQGHLQQEQGAQTEVSYQQSLLVIQQCYYDLRKESSFRDSGLLLLLAFYLLIT